jgi:hypothetical protein
VRDTKEAPSTAARWVSLSLIRLVAAAVVADSRRKMQLATAFDHFSYHSPANKIICNIARVGNEQQNASQRILIPAKCNYNLPWHSQTKTFLSSTPPAKSATAAQF